MNFNVEKTKPDADGDSITLWLYDSPTGRPVPLLRASTYKQLNDSAMKLFGDEAWCKHIKDVFNEDMSLESIFLCADLYQRNLISTVKDWLKDADKSIGEGVTEFKKNVKETTKVPEKNVSNTEKVAGKSDETKTSDEDLKAISKAPYKTMGDVLDSILLQPSETEQKEEQPTQAQSYEFVDSPAHYDGTKCMDEMIALYGREAVRNFCICNAYKYRYRAGRKPGNDAVEDLNKAKWYENYVIENKL